MLKRALAVCVLLCACSPVREQGERALPKVAEAPSASPAPLVASAPADAPTSEPRPERPPIVFAGGEKAITGEHGVVVSVEEQATRAGVRVLELGGNAVDAAVAVAFALAVTHPSAGNIGGGGFMLARPPAGATVSFDFRESSPASLTRKDWEAMIARRGRGAAAAGVPGTVSGLALAHERFGKLPWRAVLAPAIELAEKGHRLGKRQAQVLVWSAPLLAGDTTFRRIFAEGGKPKRSGAWIVQPELGKTLTRIAERGRAGFYEGETARAIASLTTRGGLITEQDLADYRAVVREPLSVDYRGVRVQTMPPPSAGGTVLAVQLLAHEQLGTSSAGSEALERHLELEVFKRAQALRRLNIFDLDSLPAGERAQKLEHWLDLGRLFEVPVDAARATPAARLSPFFKRALREVEHTTHFSVVDASGFAVSCTVTLSASFGSKVFVPSAGFVLNNAVASFGSMGENQPAPSRRTTSSMAPTLLLDGERTIAVLGTPGGDTIPNTLVQLVRHLVDHGLPLDRAVDAPRLHHGFVPDEARYEGPNPPAKALLGELRRLGHKVSARRAPIGDANCIVLDGNRAHAYADPREGGLALAATPPRRD